MISITQDAQFMTNIVAANPIPAGKDFYVANDQNDEPAVFSCSSDNKLEAVIMVNGIATLIDYGSLLSITSSVQAVSVQQSADGTVFLAVAVDAGNSQSNLMVLPSIPKASLANPPVASVLALDNLALVYDIYLSPFAVAASSGSTQVPRLFLGFQPKGRITETHQLGWIQFNQNPSGSTYMTVDTTWQLSADPLAILDVAFLNADRLGVGVAVLYQSSAGPMIQFDTFEGDFTVQLHCPSNAQSLTSFYDPVDTTSSLIVGGDALTLFTWDDYTTANAAGTVISGGSQNPIGVKDMHCVQTSSNLCIWYTTSADAVYYYTTTTTKVSAGTLVQLLPKASAARISGLLSLRSSGNIRVDSLLSVDETGDLTLLQKAADTGIWTHRSLFVASATNNLNIPSFTFRLAATTDDPGSTTLANCQLQIASSGLVSTLLNGTTTTIAPAGDWYQADAHGCVTLIVSINDISTNSITVIGVWPKNGSQESLTPVKLDPSNDLKTVLSSKFQGKTGADLLQMKTQSNNKLVTDPSIQEGDANTAIGAFQQLTATNPPAQPVSQAVTGKAFTASAPAALGLDDFEEAAWETFHFFEKVADDVDAFFVKEYNNVKHFVLTWAEKTYNFILDTVQQIAKAVSWVFNKIKVLVEDLIDFIGFLFAWDDILDTADSIETFFNAALGYARQEVDIAGLAAEKWISGLTGQITTAAKPANTSAGSDYQDPNGTSETAATHKGAHFNWTSYQVTHGGAGTRSQITPPSGGNSPDPTQDLQNMYNAITNEAKTFDTFMQNLVGEVKDLFTPGTDTDAVFKKIGNDVVGLLQKSLLNLVKFFTSGADLVIDLLSEVLNAPIQVPVLSALWELITKGRPFTVLNCISLILAAPTCILYKVVAKTAPPKLAGRLTVVTFGQMVTGTGDASLSSDVTLVMTATAPAIAIITGVVTVLSQALDDGPVPTIFQASLPPQPTMMVAAVSLGKDDFLDLLGLVFSGLGLFGSWPLPYNNALDLRWSSWGLGVCDGMITGVGWAIRSKTGVPRREVQRWIGPFSAVIATPGFALDEAVAANSLNVASIDKVLTVANIVQGVFVVIAAWANGVTCFTDGVDDPVSQAAFAVGEITYWLSQSYRGIAKVGYFWEVYADYLKKQQGGK